MWDYKEKHTFKHFTMEKTKLLLVRFQNTLAYHQLEAFRGAIINSLQEKDILFHNHLSDEGGLRYAYPLIQYKRINNKAAILCFGIGTESIGKLFQHADFDLNLNGKHEKFSIDNISANNYLIQAWDARFQYSIRKWMALNQENYEKYIRLESMVEKTQFLEHILRGNILSFAKGLGIFIDKQVECVITQLSEPTVTRYKGVKLTMFDAEFATNVSIPDYAGLGKGVSIGQGVVVRKKETNKKNQ